MKEPEDKEIYNLFRTRLTDTSNVDAHSEENWEGMIDLLDGRSKGKVVVIRFDRIAAGIAAMLLLFTGWWLLKPAVTGNDMVIGAVSKAIVTPLKPASHGDSRGTINPVNHRKVLQAVSNKPAVKDSNFYPGINHHNNLLNAQNNYPDSIKANFVASGVLDLNHGAIDDFHSSALNSIGKIDSTHRLRSVLNDNQAKKHISPGTHGITLAVLAAPDINSVNSFNNAGQVGTNLGLQLSVKLNKRFSITSGATYAVKPYETGISNYRSANPGWWSGSRFAALGKPDNITANCKVLDIPLNINYQVTSKGKNDLKIGGGLSSYFMLREDYHFNFADQATSPAKLQINNQNRHLFGVFNLDATYTRRIDNRFGIMIQPYAKLPLTSIGFGQVDLRSTGVALGLSWDINSFKTK